MKPKSLIILCAIGLANVLVFMFIPPIFSLEQQLYSGTIQQSYSLIITLVYITYGSVIGVIGYTTFALTKKVVMTAKRSVKLTFTLIPFGVWTVSLFLGIVMTREGTDLWISFALASIFFMIYSNIGFMKKALTLIDQEVKFLHTIIPFGIWIVTFLQLVSTGLWGKYLFFCTQDSGDFIGGSFIVLGFISLALLNCISLLVVAIISFIAFKSNKLITKRSGFVYTATNFIDSL